MSALASGLMPQPGVGYRNVHETGSVGTRLACTVTAPSAGVNLMPFPEIDQDLDDAVRVAVHKRNPGVYPHLQADLLFARHRLHHGDRLANQVRDGTQCSVSCIFPVSARVASSRSCTIAPSWLTLFRIVPR